LIDDIVLIYMLTDTPKQSFFFVTTKLRVCFTVDLGVNRFVC